MPSNMIQPCTCNTQEKKSGKTVFTRSALGFMAGSGEDTKSKAMGN